MAEIHFWLLLKMSIPSKDKHMLPKNNSNISIMPNIYVCVYTNIYMLTHTQNTTLSILPILIIFKYHSDHKR